MEIKMPKTTTTYSSIFGVIVAAKRKQLNLEQVNIAEKMGLSQASYSRLESGKSTFTIDQMFQCAESLNIPISELFDNLLNTIESTKKSDEIIIQAQERGIKNNTGAIIAGAALAALVIGLIGKTKK